MWCNRTPLPGAYLGRLRVTASAVVLSGMLSAGALAQSPSTLNGADSELEAEALSAEAGLEAEESQSVTSEELYRNFKRRFEARGGARNFRISVTTARGVTPPGRTSCEAGLDLPAGSVEITCKNLDDSVDAFLIDNQDAPGDSVLPEAHDTITPLGRLDAAGRGAVRVSWRGWARTSSRIRTRTW